MRSHLFLRHLLVVLLVAAGCKPDTVRSPVEDRLPEALQRARAASDAGDWATAQTLYRRYIDTNPDAPAADYARIEVGRHEVQAQRCTEAYRWLDRAKQSTDRALSLRASLYRAQCLASESRTAEALDEARPLLSERFSGEEWSMLERTVLRSAATEPTTARTWVTVDGLLASDQATGSSREQAINLLRGAASLVGPSDLQQALTELRQEGEPWRLLATRALTDAIEARDSALSAELAESLRAHGHTQDPDVQTLLMKVDTWLEGTPYSVGVLLPLSGRGQEIGKRILRGIELANAPGGGPQLVIEDTRGDPNVAAEALDRLLGEAGVAAVLGPVGSASVREAARQADRVGVPLLAFSPDEQVVSRGSSVFRMLYSPREEVRALIRHARRAGVERFTVLYPNHGYGRAVRAVYETEVVAAGGNTCAAVGYEPATKSFVEPVREVLETGCDGILLADRPNRIALIAPTFALEGAWSTPAGQSRSSEEERAVHFFLPSISWSNDLVRGSARYLQGALVTQPYLAQGTSSANVEFRTAYESRHQNAPDALGAAGYDAYRIVTSALVGGATKRRDLLEAVRMGSAPTLVTSIRGLSQERAPLEPPVVCALSGAELIPRSR